MVTEEHVRLFQRLNDAMSTYYEMNPRELDALPPYFLHGLQVEAAMLEWFLGERKDPPDLSVGHVEALEATVNRLKAQRN